MDGDRFRDDNGRLSACRRYRSAPRRGGFRTFPTYPVLGNGLQAVGFQANINGDEADNHFPRPPVAAFEFAPDIVDK